MLPGLTELLMAAQLTLGVPRAPRRPWASRALGRPPPERP